jgi:hypothetical protein
MPCAYGRPSNEREIAAGAAGQVAVHHGVHNGERIVDGLGRQLSSARAAIAARIEPPDRNLYGALFYDPQGHRVYMMDGGMMRYVPPAAQKFLCAQLSDYTQMKNFNSTHHRIGPSIPQEAALFRLDPGPNSAGREPALYLRDCHPDGVQRGFMYRPIVEGWRHGFDTTSAAPITAIPFPQMGAAFDDVAHWRHMNCQTCEIFENQRWLPIVGWGKRLLPTDRERYSSRNGKVGWKTLEDVPPPDGFVWGDCAWQRVADSSTDPDGWTYAVDFPFTYGLDAVTRGVRRRKHQRVAVKGF